MQAVLGCLCGRKIDIDGVILGKKKYSSDLITSILPLSVVLFSATSELNKYIFTFCVMN